MSKISDHAAAVSLGSLLKTSFTDTVNDVMSEGRWPLPFSLQDCRVVLDRVAIIPVFMLGQRSGQRLIANLSSEMEMGTPMIFFDEHVSGKDGIYLVREVDDVADGAEKIGRYAALQKEPNATLAAFNDRTFIALRLKNFF